MKHLSATVLLCGASILGASAQNIIVTDKDGVAHRFNADYVKEITFEKIASQGDAVDLKITSVNVNPWNKTNIQVILNCDNGDQITADIYQPEALWLTGGMYAVDGSCAPYTLDPGYSSAIIGGEKKDIESGSLEIKLDGDVYTFNVDLGLKDGTAVKGSFTGKTDAYGPAVDYTIIGCSYSNVNDPASNGFYYNLNDENWTLEMSLYLFSEGNAPKPGVYTFSESTENGCAGSYVHLYRPYNDVTSFSEGTVTVEGEGDATVVKIDGILANGLHMTASYSGKLPERPSLAQDIDFAVTSVSVNPWNLTNVQVILNGDNGDQIVADIYQPETFWLAPGKYTLDGSGQPYTFDPGYSSVVIGGEKRNLEGGTLDIALDGDVYSFNVDLALKDGSAVKGSFTGKTDGFGRAIDYSIAGCSYANVNDPASNGFYYNLNDENWKLEMRLELFSEGDAPKTGTYSFSESTADGSAGSYVHLYSPYNDVTSFSEGTVTVEGEGDATVVKIDGTLANGLHMTATYSGNLPARSAE